MKRILVQVLLLALAGAAEAEVLDMEDSGEVSKGGPVHPDEDNMKLVSSPVGESTRPEGDFTQRNEANVSPGAESRTLDPHYLEVKVVYPEKQPSWWERAFNYFFK